MKFIKFIVLLLVIAGALNWGLWGFANYDLVAHVFGSNTAAWARVVYCFVGLAGVWSISFLFCPHFYSCKCKKD